MIELSTIKLAHHPQWLDQLRAGRQPAPLSVQIILSDLCNQDCGFCAYRLTGYPSNQLFGGEDGEHNPRRFLPTAKALEVLDDCAALGVRSVEFTGGGEPTVHRDHAEVVSRTLDLGLDVGLVTNGVILRPELLRIVPRLAWVRVSLDAGTAETYAAVRRSSPRLFALVLDHVATILRAAPELTLGVSFVVTRENHGEAHLAAARAREAGASYFRLAAAFTPAWERYYDGWLDAARDNCLRACQLQRDGFAVVDQFTPRYADLARGSPQRPFCAKQHANTYVAADQNVYRCCALAYNRRGLIGSIRAQRFRDLWTSEEKRADFAAFDARSCGHCPFDEQNRVAEYLLTERPPHVNFV